MSASKSHNPEHENQHDTSEQTAAFFHNVVTGDRKNLQEKLASQQAGDLIDQLNAYSKHPATLKSLTELLLKVDQSPAMQSFRTWWDERDHLTQWALMHSIHASIALATLNPIGPIAFSNSGPIQTLIRFGFINYKGDLNENGQVMAQKIDSRGGWDEVLKYGVKFGKYFVPELAEVEPLVEPILKLSNISDDLMAHARHTLRQHHEKLNHPEKNIDQIQNNARGQVQTLLSKKSKNRSKN